MTIPQTPTFSNPRLNHMHVCTGAVPLQRDLKGPFALGSKGTIAPCNGPFTIAKGRDFTRPLRSGLIKSTLQWYNCKVRPLSPQDH
jgi:hypothetical protein